MTNSAPVTHQVLLGCDPPEAARAWTEHLGEWWPVATHSVLGASAVVRVVDGVVTESTDDGQSFFWGRMSPDVGGSSEAREGRLRVTWQPGTSGDEATWFRLEFAETAVEGTCLLGLEHGGWENRSPEVRARYLHDWPTVLDCLADWVGLPAEPAAEAEHWLVLQHTPGPNAPATGVFTSPDFPHHPRFVASLLERGLVVAAGPLTDHDGDGMTVLRAPDFATARAVIRQAQVADLSVSSELLRVRVRPWQVRMHA